MVTALYSKSPEVRWETDDNLSCCSLIIFNSQAPYRVKLKNQINRINHFFEPNLFTQSIHFTNETVMEDYQWIMMDIWQSWFWTAFGNDLCEDSSNLSLCVPRRKNIYNKIQVYNNIFISVHPKKSVIIKPSSFNSKPVWISLFSQ